MTPSPDLSFDKNSDEKQKLRLWLRMLDATRILETIVRERLKKEFNTTLPRFDVMAALFKHYEIDGERSGITMTELSRDLRVSNGNVTGIIDRLVTDGAVLRVQNPQDRRANKVQLTPKGYSEFKEMAEAHESWINELLADLPDGQVETLVQHIEDIKTMITGQQ